jgi:hypothetical protein
MEPHEEEEGWFTDPFGRHEARWLSSGKPTKLVRDGEVESYDEPPDEEPGSVPERVEHSAEANNGADLIRAGDSSTATNDLGSLTQRMSDGALEGGAHPEVSI